MATLLPDDLVPGRSCDGCTMCCKLMEIDVLAKPRAVWCPKCDQKRGCTIYEVRPEPCRIFYCGYRKVPALDDRWKPSKAKFLVNYESRNNRIVIHVDPARAGAWRTEPYYSAIKDWAKNAVRQNGMVIVWTGDTATAVLPGREKDLGRVRDDQILIASLQETANGPVYDVTVSDPTPPG
ncbi:YkgJ family cysteine cluster protein [Hyphomicrobium sp.]|uniref:YkgJ family cysteine cluster protein n=1 Tax=Hyphomicrobium sp. TaxID=82 RepID=UPI002E2F217C|nr:YkgJ family cysteine cluster protein [Hyphomicrobium sp.]HEX2842460.1 YkgJ family cysteine cluster protein [Hyphomicrobium sp.]